MKLLVLQFSPACCHFIPHRSNSDILFSALFSNSLILYSSLKVRDRILHHWVVGSIMVLYTLIFVFLDGRQEKRF
jgi:hypothetical protein